MTVDTHIPGQIPVSELRDQLSAVVDSLRADGKAIQLTKHGRPVAVMIGYEAFEAILEELDDASDYKAVAVHDTEADLDLVVWDEVKRDLGLL